MKTEQKGSIKLLSVIVLFSIAAALFFYFTSQKDIENITPIERNDDMIQGEDKTQNGILNVEEPHVSRNIQPKNITTICGDFIMPVPRNISDESILRKLEKNLSFENITKIDDDIFCQGFVDIDYKIIYESDNILTISFITSTIGAYSSEFEINYLINLKTGETIKIEELFKTEMLEDLVALMNNKLEDNIEKKLNYAKTNDFSGENIGCSEEEILDLIELRKQFEINYGKFTKNDLLENKYNLIINSNRITATYSFGFGRAFRACEPSGQIILGIDEIANFIKPDGLLSYKFTSVDHNETTLNNKNEFAIIFKNLLATSYKEYSNYINIEDPEEGHTFYTLTNIYHGFKESDFDNVEAYQGKYFYMDGNIVFKENNSTMSDANVITINGYKQLLENTSKRLGYNIETENDVENLIKDKLLWIIIE